MPPKFTPLSMGRKVLARTMAVKAKMAVKGNANPTSLKNVKSYSPLRIPLRYLNNGKIRYNNWSTREPYKCGIATGVTMLTLSDLFAQRYTSNEPYNWKRTFGMALFGATYYGVFMKRLYFQYEIWFGAKATFKSSAQKTSFDLFINSPFILLPYYYLLTQSIQGYSLKEIEQKFRSEFWGSYIGTLGFWIPGCLGNFYFVPVQLRILFLCWLSFCHKFWLSWFSNKDKIPNQEEALNSNLNNVNLQV